jgi:hypothetical protein
MAAMASGLAAVFVAAAVPAMGRVVKEREASLAADAAGMGDAEVLVEAGMAADLGSDGAATVADEG